ncbi:MAG TPA: hypothetical protein P5267_02325 [Patescibacteria group bacterium]|nr:hypothetical protein [Patescibacteria group bacterium]
MSIFKKIWRKLNSDIKIVSLPNKYYSDGWLFTEDKHPWYIEIIIWLLDINGNLVDDLRRKGKTYPYIILVGIKPLIVLAGGLLLGLGIIIFVILIVSLFN